MRYTLLIFLLACNCLFAQIPKSKDSLEIFIKTKPKDTTYVLALNEFAFLKIQEGNYDEANSIIQKMENLTNQLHYKTGFYKITNMKGVVEYSKQNNQQALQYFTQCIKIIKKYKLEKKYQQNALNNISIIYDQLGDRDLATKYALELINFQEKNNLNPLKTAPYDQIGKNLKFYKKYDEALVYFNKTLKIESQNKNYTGMAISENNIANVYEDLNQNKTAIEHLKKGLQYAEKANYKLLQTDLLTNLGRLNFKEKNWKEAEQQLLKSEKLSLELDAKSSLKIAYQNLGDLYERKGNHALSLQYYQKAFEIAKTLDDPEFYYTISENLSQYYANSKDYKKAYFYLNEATFAKDSVFKIKTLENTENLLRKYETEKKQQEIQKLSAENTLKNLKIKNSERQRWYFIIGSLLLATIGGLLYFMYQRSKKTNAKLTTLNTELDEANKNKMRFFGILNHDLRSPVSSLVHFLQLQKEAPDLMDENTKEKLSLQTEKYAHQLLNTMEDLLLWSKSQMEKFKPEKTNFTINTLFNEVKNEFLWVEKIPIQFEENTIELFSDKEYLKTILRNLINNALKVLDNKENPFIKISAINHKNSVDLLVWDNGGGTKMEKFRALYDENTNIGIKQGLGLHVIRDLSKAIGAEITVNSDEEKGETEFRLSVKKI